MLLEAINKKAGVQVTPSSATERQKRYCKTERGVGGGVDQYNICCPIYKGQRLLEDSGEGGRMESLLAICLLSLFHPILKLSDGGNIAWTRMGGRASSGHIDGVWVGLSFCLSLIYKHLCPNRVLSFFL